MLPILGMGLFLSISTGFFQLRKAPFILKNTFGKILKNKKAFAATATALGATVGTGNIIGVASAIAVGGAGAVFWMWCGAFLGMMLKFSEAALAVKYHGGAMVYIEKAFGKRSFSILWCICCILASFGGGNMMQTHAAGAAFEQSFKISPIIIGFLISILTFAVLFCGAKTVMAVSSTLVPIMALFYVIGCFAVLFIYRENLAAVFGNILSSAFEPISASGGFFGLLVSNALRAGISKGTFTHEAGMGSASLAHSESTENHPLFQGCWGIVEVFIDTIFVCTLTAFVILSSPFVSSKEPASEIFHSCFGIFGDIFLSVSMFLFALAAVIGWAFYGEKSLKYITNSRFCVILYRILFCFAAIIGSFLKLSAIWGITDIFNGLMIFPNLAALAVLSPEIIKMAKGKDFK